MVKYGMEDDITLVDWQSALESVLWADQKNFWAKFGKQEQACCVHLHAR